MNKIIQLKARLRAAQAELSIRTRTHNSASRAYNKVVARIAELEKRLKTWRKFHLEANEYSEEMLLAMLEEEKLVHKRVKMLERIHQRYCTLRTQPRAAGSAEVWEKP